MADLTKTVTRRMVTDVTYRVAASERFSPNRASHVLHVARESRQVALCGFGPVVSVANLGREETRTVWCEGCVEQDPCLVRELQEEGL